MNINLRHACDPNTAEQYIQEEIEEHIEIMRSAGVPVTDVVMLLPDLEYLGAGVYRIWTMAEPPEGQIGGDPNWCWVNTDGEVIRTQRPWAVE